MNPLKYAQMMKYLTRAKKEKPDLPDVFPASEAPIPPVREDVETMDAINAFVRRERQQKAGGGMLVQPGFGGVRQGYREDKLTDKYKETEAYKKKITPKGYIGISELIELVDNPKLKLGNFQQARKFERNPKKYPGKKNYVYNYIKKLLNEKQVGKAGSESLAAQKFFYKKPTKAELDKINSFIDSRILETGTVDNVKKFHKEFGKLFEGKKTKGFFNDTLSLNKARAALKKYGIKATDSQLARAMMRLGQIYDGHTFQNEINIPKNKSAGKFIEKSFNELDIYNGWRSASYDAAMDDINKVMSKSAGDIRNFKYTLNNYIKENYPQIFKNYDVNEIFSLTTSSVRGSYPYSYFIDLTKNDINQKALSSFQGKASIAEGKIKKAITNFRRTGNQKFYNEAIRVADVFNNTTRKNFLSDERIIKVGGVNALKLEIGSQQQIKDKVGFASEYYKKNNLKKWKDQGIDIDAHTAKSGYVKTFDGKTPPRGVATFGDIIQDGKVNKKQFNTLLAKIGCPGKGKAYSGRIEFQEGLSPEVCMTRGAQVIQEKRIDSPSQKANFNKMMKVASVGKNMALLKDVLGPYGLGGDVLLEGMIAVNKTLTGGTPFKESWQDSWLSSIVGGAYDEAGQKLGRQKLFELRSGLSEGAEEFGDYNRKVEEYYNLISQRNNLDLFKGSGDLADTSQEFKFVDNKIKTAERELGRMETRINAQGGFEAAENEFNRKTAERQDADAATSPQSIGRRFVEDNQLNEMLRNDFSGLSSDALPMQKEPRPVLANYETFKPEIPTLSQYKDMFTQAGVEAPSDKILEQDLNQERFRQLFTQPGMKGASDTFFGDLTKGKNITSQKPEDTISEMEREIIGQTNIVNPYYRDTSRLGTGLRGFAAAGGGIAKLAGIDQGPPPVRGPNSQGLQGLLKRGIKI